MQTALAYFSTKHVVSILIILFIKMQSAVCLLYVKPIAAGSSNETGYVILLNRFISLLSLGLFSFLVSLIFLSLSGVLLDHLVSPTVNIYEYCIKFVISNVHRFQA